MYNVAQYRHGTTTKADNDGQVSTISHMELLMKTDIGKHPAGPLGDHDALRKAILRMLEKSPNTIKGLAAEIGIASTTLRTFMRGERDLDNKRRFQVYSYLRRHGMIEEFEDSESANKSRVGVTNC
jgi:hypothetical protein